MPPSIRRRGDAGIEHFAAIDRGTHAQELHFVAAHLDLGHLGEQRAERLGECDPTAAPCLLSSTQRCAPASQLRRSIEHRKSTRIAGEQPLPVAIGIFFGGVRKLVDEALEGENVRPVAGGAHHRGRALRCRKDGTRRVGSAAHSAFPTFPRGRSDRHLSLSASVRSTGKPAREWWARRRARPTPTASHPSAAQPSGAPSSPADRNRAGSLLHGPR